MRKIIPILILFLFLSACNYPAQEISDEDVIATNVAIILTSAPSASVLPDKPTATIEIIEILEETIVVEPVETEAYPIEETIETATIPTDTPTPEPTATATIAPTLSEEDPVETLGQPTIENEFIESAAWEYEDDWSQWSLADGKLKVVSKGTPYWNSWYTTRPELKNGYIETTISLANCSGYDRFGLVFRLTDDNEFYFLGLTCNGFWGFSRYTVDHKIVDILDYQNSDKLNPINENNRLGVLMTDESFDFYINGIKVGSAVDDTLDEEGTSGFVSMSTGTANFTTYVERLQIWQK